MNRTMSLTIRRVRGALLRLARARRVAVVAGATLLAPSVWLLMADFIWESWLSDGFGLVLGATGTAIILAGLGGHRPDWRDPDSS